MKLTAVSATACAMTVVAFDVLCVGVAWEVVVGALWNVLVVTFGLAQFAWRKADTNAQCASA